jgi:hypothetical protein
MSLEKPRKMRNKSATNAVRQPERNFQDPATTHNKTPTNCNFLPDVGLFVCCCWPARCRLSQLTPDVKCSSSSSATFSLHRNDVETVQNNTHHPFLFPL